ncbi:hypothetical protein [Nostoc sp. WHI]|nr:hypothetical protein [Nostoc sp. WHI]
MPNATLQRSQTLLYKYSDNCIKVVDAYTRAVDTYTRADERRHIGYKSS